MKKVKNKNVYSYNIGDPAVLIVNDIAFVGTILQKTDISSGKKIDVFEVPGYMPITKDDIDNKFHGIYPAKKH